MPAKEVGVNSGTVAERGDGTNPGTRSKVATEEKGKISCLAGLVVEREDGTNSNAVAEKVEGTKSGPLQLMLEGDDGRNVGILAIIAGEEGNGTKADVFGS